MNLSKLVHSKSGKYVMSILLGFGLASLFRTVCKGKNCIVYHTPPTEEISNQIYKQDNKCYSYKPVSVHCDNNKNLVN